MIMQILCQQWTLTSRYCEALVCICFLFYENMNLSSCLVFILSSLSFFFFSLFSFQPLSSRKRNWGYCMRCMRFPLEKLTCRSIFPEQARQPELSQKRWGCSLGWAGWLHGGFLGEPRTCRLAGLASASPSLGGGADWVARPRCGGPALGAFCVARRPPGVKGLVGLTGRNR